MTTRQLITTMRSCKTGTKECNELLEECARKIEDFLGGPEEEPASDDTETSLRQPNPMNTTVVKPPRIRLYHQSLVSVKDGSWGWGKECPFCWGGVITSWDCAEGEDGRSNYNEGRCIQCGTTVDFLDVAKNEKFPRYLPPPTSIPKPIQAPIHTAELERHKYTLETYGTDGDVPFVILKDPESGQLENITFPHLTGYEIFAAMAKRDSVNIVFRRFPVTQ